MKKCSYCAKELLQGQEFCSDYCKAETRKYQMLLERRKPLFGVVLLISILGVSAGIIMALLNMPFAFFILSCALLLLGISSMVLPFAPPELLEKQGIERAKQIVRVLGILTAVCGVIFLWMAF